MYARIINISSSYLLKNKIWNNSLLILYERHYLGLIH